METITPQFRLTEIKLKPKSYQLLSNVKMSDQQQTAIAASLKPLKLAHVQTSPDALSVKLGFSQHWDSVKDRVMEVVSRQMDPDYCASVDELKQKLLNVDSLDKRAAMVIRQVVLPVLNADGGSCELIGTENGVMRLKLVGACGTCPSSKQTLKQFVEKVVIELIPEIKSVVAE